MRDSRNDLLNPSGDVEDDDDVEDEDEDEDEDAIDEE